MLLLITPGAMGLGRADTVGWTRVMAKKRRARRERRRFRREVCRDNILEGCKY